MIISIDGEIVPPERATISVLDRGLLYGDGLFEVLRTWRGIAVDLALHLDRLYAAAATLQLRAIARELLASQVAAAIAAATGEDHRIRIVVTRGPGALSTRLADLGPGRAIVIVEPLPPRPAGVSLAIVDWPLPPRAAGGVKSLAYLDHIIARELAAAAGADEGVRLDPTGHVVEGATSNLFVVSGGTMVTPGTESGVLPGIVRARVLALCTALGVAIEVRALPLAELRGAAEAFVTSSLRGVVPVVALDGVRLATGALTQRLAQAYADGMNASADARRLL